MVVPRESTPLAMDTEGETETLKPHTQTQPKRSPWLLFGAGGAVLLATAVAVPALVQLHKNETTPPIHIAFAGNSMFYFNDFPRFFEAVATNSHRIINQDSCLHGGASIPSLLMDGNAMYPQFETPNAILFKNYGNARNITIYDYGACTVPQLLLGLDDRLDDPGYATPTSSQVLSVKEGDDDTNSNATNSSSSSGSHKNFNPCRQDPYYLQYTQKYYSERNTSWDFLIINDNTRNPARADHRALSLQFLEAQYIPMLLQLQSNTPQVVFLWTHAYRPSIPRSMKGLEDIGNFTSLTGAGVRSYQHLLENYGISSYVAPVGLAFLLVYEEHPDDIWPSLFHNADHLHASPAGTLLQGLIVHYTLFQEMPTGVQEWLDSPQDDIEYLKNLWSRARMMQHAWEPPNPFPTKQVAQYLYQVARRIMVEHEMPKTYIHYTHGEVLNNEV